MHILYVIAQHSLGSRQTIVTSWKFYQPIDVELFGTLYRNFSSDHSKWDCDDALKPLSGLIPPEHEGDICMAELKN